MPKLSVVLPCYNESKSIYDILSRFAEVKNVDTELILVNNGSTDNTNDVLNKVLKKSKFGFARSVTINKNKGYGNGILFGLKYSKGDFLAFSHADLQCDPLDIFRAYNLLIKTSNPKKTLVKGNRIGRRNFLTTILHLLATFLFFKKFDDINGQPKVLHRSLFNSLKNPPKNFAFDFYVQYVALKNNYKILNIPVRFTKRKHGQSHWASTFKSRTKTTIGFVKYMLKLRFSGD